MGRARPSVAPISEALLKEQDMTDVDVVEWNALEGPCARGLIYAVKV